ncbi:DUF5959 family protein [Streptomyces sp. NPDC086783]|uniref:DUF5959 family protein n=1 Tax=Streptomyces sp. NPDC086783 TaxID=3365758 RepID=UPI0037F48779
MDMINICDDENSLRVRITGRRFPGILHLHDQLSAEIVISGTFATGTLPISLFPADLDTWGESLSLLSSGEETHWRTENINPKITIKAEPDKLTRLAVRIDDLDKSRSSILLLLDLEEGWIEKQKDLLARVQKAWPSEVQQSAPGVYAWRTEKERSPGPGKIDTSGSASKEGLIPMPRKPLLK